MYMKRLYWEIFLFALFVLLGTFTIYNLLASEAGFWSAQSFWNATLVVCWIIVASGYWHQGAMIHKAKSATHVSFLLPCAVFVVQCVLFVKGIYYRDFALIVGAMLVNSAVAFNLYQIIRFRKKPRVK